MSLLKYLSNYWRNFEMPLINCKIILILTWSANCFIVAGIAANQEPTFAIADTKLDAPLEILSTEDNAKLS